MAIEAGKCYIENNHESICYIAGFTATGGVRVRDVLEGFVLLDGEHIMPRDEADVKFTKEYVLPAGVILRESGPLKRLHKYDVSSYREKAENALVDILNESPVDDPHKSSRSIVAFVSYLIEAAKDEIRKEMGNSNA